MLQNQFYKLIARIIGITLATILIARGTWGYGFAVIAVVAIYFAIIERPGPLFLCTLFMHFIIMSNPLLIPRLASFTTISRLTLLLCEVLLIFLGMKRMGYEKLPLITLLPYLVVALIASIGGYFPLISFFKLGSFLLFLSSIYIGLQNLNSRPREIEIIRAGIFAFSIIAVYGSILTLPFPVVAYYTSMRGALVEYGISYAENIFLASSDGMKLFTGVAVHSQFMGPLLACTGVWLLCDMLLVERRVSLLHLFLLVPLPVLLYMTRARIGLLSIVAGFVIVYFYLIPKIKFDRRTSVGVLAFMSIFMAVLVISSTILELRGGYLSKWLRKTEDVKHDQRSLSTAVTDSRQGVIFNCMDDFYKNKLLGMGFQVVKEHQELFRDGKITIYSAPVEKGVLPIMILGETGVVGLIAFIVFLIQFFTRCRHQGLWASGTCFATLLATNMAEATFFSPGGSGGVFWMICAGGGFVIDMMARVRSFVPMAPRFEEEAFERNV